MSSDCPAQVGAGAMRKVLQNLAGEPPAPEPNRLTPSFSCGIYLAISSLSYFTAQELAFLFPEVFGLMSAIWPAAGIGLAALLLSPRRCWPALLGCLFLAGLAANLTTDRPFGASVGFMIANFCETAATAWLLSRLCGDRIGFTKVREILALVTLGILVNSVTALLGAETGRQAIGAPFWRFYWTWWVADGLGLLLVTPLIVLCATGRQALDSLSFSRRIEAVVLIAFSCFIAFMEFGWKLEISAVELAPFWLPVLLIWAALRLGPLVTVVLLSAFAFIVIGCTAAGWGTFPLGGTDEAFRLLSVQVYLGVMGITGMVLAAAVAQQRDSQALLHAVVEGTTDAVYVKDRLGRYLLFNSAAARFVGKRVSDVIGKDDTALFSPAEAEMVMAGDQVSMAAGSPRTYEENLTVAAGGVRHFLSTKGPLWNGTGELVGLFGVARDVTAQKRIEASLRASEERYRSFMQSCPDGLLLGTSDGRILAANAAACRMFECSEDELRSLGRNGVADPRDSRWENAIAERSRTGMFRGELNFRRKNGEVFPAEISTAAFLVEDGTEHTSVLVHDITARKQTEAALRASEEKFAKVFQVAPVLVAITDIASGVYLDVNEAALHFSGYTRQEVVGHTAIELGWITAEDRARMLEEVDRNNRVDALELEVRTKAGIRRHGLVNCERIAVSGRSCLLTVMVDISRLKQTQAALKESEDRYRQVERAVHDGLWDWNPFNEKTYISPRWKDIIGFEDAELANDEQTFFGRIHPEDQVAVGEAIRRHLDLKERFESTLRLRHKDGSYRWVLSRGEAIRDGSGKPIRMVGAITDITERKLAEEALQESEANYRRLFDGMLDGFALHEILCDAAGRPVDYRFLSINPAFERLTGLRREDVIGRTVLEIMPETEPSWIDRYGRVALTGEGVEFEEFSTTLGKYFEIAAFRPNPGQFATVFIDITEQKRAAAAVRASEERYRSILNASPDDITITDLEGRILMVSPAGLRMFGYNDDHVAQGLPVTDFLVPEDRPKAATRLALMFHGVMPGSNQYRAQRRDGTTFDLEVNSDFIRDASGKPTHLIFVARDITARKLTEAALATANDRLFLAARAGGVGIWDYEVKSNRLVWDDMMYRLYGVSPDQFAGAYVSWHNGVHPEDRARADAEIQSALRGEKEFDTEFRILWPDGSVHFIRALALVKRDAHGQPLNMIGTNWDITAQKVAEESLQSSLHEKEALLKEVHHRVKNNLQVVTSLLRLEAGRTAQIETKSVLSDMQGRIRSMAMLHETLYRSGTFAAVDLGAYLKQIATQLFRALVAAPGKVHLRLELATVAVEMDQAMPCGLLINELVSNSLKHAFPDGRAGEVCVSLQRIGDGPQLCLSVRDNGVGLPAAAEPGRPASLGLQLVGDLARQIEGTLEVNAGTGAVFKITFTPHLHAAAPTFSSHAVRP